MKVLIQDCVLFLSVLRVRIMARLGLDISYSSLLRVRIMARLGLHISYYSPLRFRPEGEMET